ncbi:MAG: glycosyltransferase family 4 protein [Cyanobacteriota bacterium]|nr:glycosyltransferase family 4 protein [Cyanobacteriota bacterium]
MRILIYSYNYHPEPIGIAPLMTELAEGLANKGHEVRVVTGMPNYPQRRIYDGYRGKLYCTEEINGVTIQRSYIWVRPKPGFMDRILLEGSFVLSSFLQALNGWSPDIVLLTVPPLPACVPAALLAWFHGCPLVLNLQDILPDAAVNTGLLRNKALIRVFEGLERFAYRHATKISVIADGFAKNLQDKGVPSEKMTLIPNWVDTNFIRPLPKENNAFRQANQLEGKFVVLYAGNIALTQGVEMVVQSARYLRHLRDVALVIVGEGRALESLKRVRKLWKVEEQVTLLPFQPREELPTMLAAADVGLVAQKRNVICINMPSKIPVLLASGCPILASVPLAGTAAKAVGQSGGGLVIPPEDPIGLAKSIQELYENRDRLAKLGRTGRQYAVEHFTFRQALNRYETLFQALTAPKDITDSLRKGKPEVLPKRSGS